MFEDHLFIFDIFDSIGLGVFSVSGTSIALSSGFSKNAFLSIFVGMLTGVGGGILRDVMLCKISMVLRKRIYAIAAIAGAVCYYLISVYSGNNILAVATGVLITFTIRTLAAVFKWNPLRINL